MGVILLLEMYGNLVLLDVLISAFKIPAQNLVIFKDRCFHGIISENTTYRSLLSYAALHLASKLAVLVSRESGD